MDGAAKSGVSAPERGVIPVCASLLLVLMFMSLYVRGQRIFWAGRCASAGMYHWMRVLRVEEVLIDSIHGFLHMHVLSNSMQRQSRQSPPAPNDFYPQLSSHSHSTQQFLQLTLGPYVLVATCLMMGTVSCPSCQWCQCDVPEEGTVSCPGCHMVLPDSEYSSHTLSCADYQEAVSVNPAPKETPAFSFCGLDISHGCGFQVCAG
eukprot:1141229-Pelagomonas_calceolata.AAC.1